MSIGTSHASTRIRAAFYEPLRQQACLRCGYRWWPRQVTRPVRCPACKSAYWYRPRQPVKQAQKAADAVSQAPTGAPIAQAGTESFQAALEAMKTMKQAGKSWGEIAEAIDSRFGVKLGKDQLKALVR